jgi:hypothetical protein
MRKCMAYLVGRMNPCLWAESVITLWIVSSQIKGAGYIIQLQLGRGTTELIFGGCCTVLGDQARGKPSQTQIEFKWLPSIAQVSFEILL